MAVRVSVTGGNWSDASTWQTITANSSYGTGAISTSITPRYTPVFTAPNTTNSALGCMFYFSSVSTAKNASMICNLQEYDGATWNTVATCTLSEDKLAYDKISSTGGVVSSYVFFKLSTPYKFTTTSAGYYRYSLNTTGTSVYPRTSTTSSTELHFVAIDDRTSSPAATDDLIIIGDPNGSFTEVVIDGDVACGSAQNLAAAPAPINFDNALTVSHTGKISIDNTKDTSITINGHCILGNGGSYLAGTITTPLPKEYKHEIIIKGQTAALPGMINIYNHTYDQNYQFSGAATTQVGWFSSGAGTTASPLVTTTETDWNVGDEVVITGDAYNRWEIRYIITKNSSSSYVLSDSLGGAEAGFTYTHYTTDYIINTTHNVVIRSDDSSKPWSGINYQFSSLGIQFKNVELRDIGGTTNGRYSWYPNNSARYTCNIDNCSIIPCDTNYYGLYAYNGTNPNGKITNIVSYLRNSSTGMGCLILANTAGTYENFYLIGGYSRNSSFGGYNNIYKNIYSYNGQRRATTATYNYQPIVMTGNSNTYINVNVQGSRDNAISILGTNLICKDSFFGNVYSNNHSINPGYLGSFTQIVFDNCTFDTWGTDNLWSSALDSETNSIYQNTAGSYVRFTNINGNLADTLGFYPEGNIRSTGEGLEDTTIRTIGGYPMRFRSQYGDIAIEFIQDIPTGNIKNKTMAVGVWVKIANSAFWAHTHEMPRLTVIYDNGTSVYVEAAQIEDEWQLLQIPFVPETEYGLITVIFSCASDSTGGEEYVYVTDWGVLYPAGVTLNLGIQNVWAKGLPVVPTISTLASAQDVWAVSTEGMGAGTTGEQLNKTNKIKPLTTGEFIALK